MFFCRVATSLRAKKDKLLWFNGESDLCWPGLVLWRGARLCRLPAVCGAAHLFSGLPLLAPSPHRPRHLQSASWSPTSSARTQEKTFFRDVLYRIQMRSQPWLQFSQHVNWLLISDCCNVHSMLLRSTWQVTLFKLTLPLHVSDVMAPLWPWPRVPPWGQVCVLHLRRRYKYAIFVNCQLSEFYFL